MDTSQQQSISDDEYQTYNIVMCRDILEIMHTSRHVIWLTILTSR